MCICAFLNYGLRLTEREESGFTSLDMGNIYHEALERYSKKLDRESTDWFSVTDAKGMSLLWKQ